LPAKIRVKKGGDEDDMIKCNFNMQPYKQQIEDSGEIVE
jgi:hypothetical protein